MADLSTTLDTAAATTKFIGDLASAAVTVGPVVVTIAELLGPWIPGLGPIIADIQVALPIIKEVATYAPQVSSAITNGKPAIEALAAVGQAIVSPLTALNVQFPGVAIFGVSVEEFLRRNEFTPQDLRFDRAQGNA